MSWDLPHWLYHNLEVNQIWCGTCAETIARPDHESNGHFPKSCKWLSDWVTSGYEQLMWHISSHHPHHITSHHITTTSTSHHITSDVTVWWPCRCPAAAFPNTKSPQTKYSMFTTTEPCGGRGVLLRATTSTKGLMRRSCQ